MSIIQDIEVYDRFEKIVLVHGVRYVNELAYKDFIEKVLPNNEFFGEEVRNKLIYYPTVTREPYRNNGRITDLIVSGKLFKNIGLPPPSPKIDRVMICGNSQMLADIKTLLNNLGFNVSSRIGEPGDFVIEHAFVDK